MRFKVFRFMGVVCVFMLALNGSLHAARDGRLSIDPGTASDQAPGDCNGVEIEYRVNANNDTDDGGSIDFLAVTAVDAVGNVLDTDFFSFSVGIHVDTYGVVTIFDPDGISVRPLTISLWDITDPGDLNDDTVESYKFALSGRLMDRLLVDPADFTIDGSCQDIPLVNGDTTCLPIPARAVVGMATAQAQVYWSPGRTLPGVLLSPGHYWVLGQDLNGDYYKILLDCQYAWVQVRDLQPSFDPPWNGQPLPNIIKKWIK